MAVKRRRTRKKRAASPKIVFANPTRRRRRRAVKSNPAKRRRRRRTSAVASVFHKVRHHARRVKSNPKGSVSVGSNFQDGAMSVGAGALGFFAGLAANKIFPAAWIRFRGAILAAVSLLAVWKIREKHIRIGFIGLAIEGGVDALKQNVSAFANLSADDAAEHLLGAGGLNPQINYSHGASGLGTDHLGEDEMLGADGGAGLGEEVEAMAGMFGEDDNLSGSNW